MFTLGLCSGCWFLALCAFPSRVWSTLWETIVVGVCGAEHSLSFCNVALPAFRLKLGSRSVFEAGKIAQHWNGDSFTPSVRFHGFFPFPCGLPLSSCGIFLCWLFLPCQFLAFRLFLKNEIKNKIKLLDIGQSRWYFAGFLPTIKISRITCCTGRFTRFSRRVVCRKEGNVRRSNTFTKLRTPTFHVRGRKGFCGSLRPESCRCIVPNICYSVLCLWFFPNPNGTIGLRVGILALDLRSKRRRIPTFMSISLEVIGLVA